jgi:hypothetical protein
MYHLLSHAGFRVSSSQGQVLAQRLLSYWSGFWRVDDDILPDTGTMTARLLSGEKIDCSAAPMPAAKELPALHADPHSNSQRHEPEAYLRNVCVVVASQRILPRNRKSPYAFFSSIKVAASPRFEPISGRTSGRFA